MATSTAAAAGEAASNTNNNNNNNNNNSNNNYPILKLIPLNQAQCASALFMATTNDNDGELYEVPPDIAKKRRSTMCLKLCSESDDIVDVDNSLVPPEPTRYARFDDEGNYSCVLKLGRSEFACIAWNKISRSLCDIGMTRSKMINNKEDTTTAWIKMRKGVDQHAIYMDGKMIVKSVGQRFRVNDGAILALYGATGIAYRIKIEPNGALINNSGGEDESSMIVASTRKRGAAITTDSIPPQPNNDDSQDNANKRHKHPGVLQDAHSLMENSTECPLCYEIFVKTVAVHPCGHNFCEECADTHLASINDDDDCTDVDTTTATTTTTKKTECPCCRGQIQGFTRNRVVDTMTWAVALNGCFDRDDAISYLKRRENAKMDAPTEEQKECILRCGKGEQEGIMNGNHQMHGNGPVFMEPKPLASSSMTTICIPTLPPLSTSQARANLNNHNNNEVVDLT